jgi:nitrogen fixation protein FixH
MANSSAVAQGDSRSAGTGKGWWAFVPVGLLTALLSIQGVMVAFAVSDPSFAIEPSYYQKASNWDRHQRELGASQALGWRANIRVGATQPGGDREVIIELLDSAARPVRGVRLEAVYFHNARAALRAQRELKASATGTFSAALPLHRAGLWVFQLQGTRGADHFQQELRVDVQ